MMSLDRDLQTGMSDRLAAVSRKDYSMLKDGQPITAEQRRALLHDFDNWFVQARARGVRSLKAAGALIGVSPTVLSEVRGGKYAGDSDAVLRRIDTFLAEELQRSGRPDFRGFVSLAITGQIWGFLKIQVTRGSMGCVIAPPGAGKTMHIKAYEQLRPGVQIVRIEDAPADRKVVSELLCTSIRDKGDIRPLQSAEHKPHRRRVGLIKDFLASHRNTVLLVDEAQKLSANGLELLRDLHDTSDLGDGRRVPIILWADKTFRHLLQASGRGSKLQITSQLRSRLSVLDIEEYAEGDDGGLYTTQDIVELTRNKRIRIVTPDGVRWLKDLANVRGDIDNDGHLRLVVAVLETCVELFAKELAAGGLLNPEHMRAAMTETFASRASEIDAQAGGRLLATA